MAYNWQTRPRTGMDTIAADKMSLVYSNAQNPLHTFPRNFPEDGKVANLLRSCCGLVSDTANKSATSWQKIVVMEFGKRYDTTDTTYFCLCQLVTDLFMLLTCCGLATEKSSAGYGLVKGKLV